MNNWAIIKSLCKENNIELEELEEKLGMKRYTIMRDSSENNNELKLIDRICEIFDVNPNIFFTHPSILKEKQISIINEPTWPLKKRNKDKIPVAKLPEITSIQPSSFKLAVLSLDQLESFLDKLLSKQFQLIEERQKGLEGQKCYTINKIAKRLGKSHATIKTLCKVGAIKTTKSGLITEDAINEYLSTI